MLLQTTNLTKQYTGQHSSPVEALRGVSFELAEGEFASVQGPSGCGKSTLLLAVGALLQPTEGQVKIAGKNPYKLSPEGRAEFRAKHIGFVFQQFHLVPYLSVRDNVLVPILTGESNATPKRADALLEQFNLTQRATHPPAQLSTGERQRTAGALQIDTRRQCEVAAVEIYRQRSSAAARRHVGVDRRGPARRCESERPVVRRDLRPYGRCTGRGHCDGVTAHSRAGGECGRRRECDGSAGGAHSACNSQSAAAGGRYPQCAQSTHRGAE